MNKCKNGATNIFITVGLLLIIIIFAIIFLIYSQINNITENIRKDLFYISNNALMAMNENDLAYSMYTFNKDQAIEKLELLLRKNYVDGKGSITKISIKQLDLNNISGKPSLYIKINVEFESIIAILNDKLHSFDMQETVPISLMYY